ncbi:MAG: hypothetical protein NVSMB49_29250 [Ktedonobacteraceae bacterium]
MIITIRSQATSEERTHLITQVCRITGSSRPITTIVIDGHELLVLDGAQIDHHAQTFLNEQAAVEQITRVKTAYKLVSRVWKAENTHVLVGTGHDCEQGGTTPMIIAALARSRLVNSS